MLRERDEAPAPLRVAFINILFDGRDVGRAQARRVVKHAGRIVRNRTAHDGEQSQPSAMHGDADELARIPRAEGDGEDAIVPIVGRGVEGAVEFAEREGLREEDLPRTPPIAKGESEGRVVGWGATNATRAKRESEGRVHKGN